MDDCTEKPRLEPTGESESSDHIAFAEAAQLLGVDAFTFYTLVQRAEIMPVLAPWGEFVVSQRDLADLVAEKR